MKGQLQIWCRELLWKKKLMKPIFIRNPLWNLTVSLGFRKGPGWIRFPASQLGCHHFWAVLSQTPAEGVGSPAVS